MLPCVTVHGLTPKCTSLRFVNVLPTHQYTLKAVYRRKFPCVSCYFVCTLQYVSSLHGLPCSYVASINKNDVINPNINNFIVYLVGTLCAS